MDKYQMILDAERQFAREVTLGVIVSRPSSVWHYFIPGMFIIDSLRRNMAIREYTKHFLFPRKLALDVARSRLTEAEKASAKSHLEAEIEKWLQSLRLFSQNLARKQLAAVEVLTVHYRRLLETSGLGYYDLVQNAYESRDAFEAYIRQLTEAENTVDQAILELVGKNEKLREKLKLEAQQVAKRRNKILEDIF